MPNDQITAHDSETDWLEDAEELPPRPRRRLFTPASLALLGVLLTACGFIAGVLVEKGQSSSSQGAGGNLAARFAAATGGSSSRDGARTGAGVGAGALFAGRGGSAARQITVGQVSYVEGKTLYVESSEGNTVKVKTSAASSVSKTVTASVKSIHPGESVVVQGSTDSSTGTVTARTISVGAGGAGFGGALGGGGLRSLFGGAGAGGSSAGSPSSGSAATGGGGEPALFGK